jgi:oligoribonuclease NrnB/cAMP/cGMP phosphodiesterase (DHH superfamily)
MVHILTHNDLDGYAAGYVALRHFGEQNCDIEHFCYDREPDIEKYGEGDIIVITDYSLTNDQYRQILAQIGDEGHLIWLDHHITAIKRYQEADDVFCEGIRSTKYCGAALTWFYFQDFDTEDVEGLPYEIMIEKLPEWLRLVDAWDTWKTDSIYRHNAELFNLGVSNKLSIHLMECIDKVPSLIYDYIELGEHYEEFKNDWAKQFREKYMFDVTIDGNLFGVDKNLSMCILNLGCANSTYFGDNIDKYDVCMTICFNGREFVVSFYSNKDYVNCAEAATHFGGGGHKGAAGCAMRDSSLLLAFTVKPEND